VQVSALVELRARDRAVQAEIVGEFPPTATEEQLGVAMTGGGRNEEQVA